MRGMRVTRGAVASAIQPIGETAPASSADALENVIAVVVTFNPGADLALNLAALRAQLGNVVVIDNGSADAAGIEMLARAAGCRFVGNPTNLGIAAALSQGARLAMAEGFDWLATFDQD